MSKTAGRTVRMLSVAFALMLLFAGRGLASEGSTSPTVRALCSLSPKVMDVSRHPGPLIARIEIFSADGLTALDAGRISPGVYVRSVAGTQLPEPGGDAEGIGERRVSRRLEDTKDLRGRSPTPNGIPEAVVRFERPSDGDPRTPEDGDAGDVLAMLTDALDGSSVEVCLGGRVNDSEFVCCDSLRVRNRGLRNLPKGLFPASDDGSS